MGRIFDPTANPFSPRHHLVGGTLAELGLLGRANSSNLSAPSQGIDPMNKVESGGDLVSFIFGVPTTSIGKIDDSWVATRANTLVPNAPTCPARSLSVSTP